ncbi:MAG: hypothetical protein KDB22_14380 [Planctomycetales bacterium]|nr:hypothetical protein [Planctomycetales bacterium]
MTLSVVVTGWGNRSWVSWFLLICINSSGQRSGYIAAQLVVCLAAVSCVACSSSHAAEPLPRAAELKLRAALVAIEDVNSEAVEAWRADGINAIALMLDDSTDETEKSHYKSAALKVIDSELELYYWVEVARCPLLANAHPMWMASQQTHPEWKRLFRDVPTPGPQQVVKTYPWVPILSRETFTAQKQRVQQLLSDLPEATGVFLNDIQGAPSACGCGNPLCRWTSDYGKRRSTTPLDSDAAAMFVEEIKKFVPQSQVIPVWVTECEEHDGAADGLCAGVGCFDGICWKSYTAQLAPVETSCSAIAVLATYKQFHRDVAVYGPTAGWIHSIVASFQSMPAKYGHAPVASSRLIPVLQGWNVNNDELAAQIRQVESEDVQGYVIAYAEIEQGWEPKLADWTRD